jgi:sterol 24-C-methyltransferase
MKDEPLLLSAPERKVVSYFNSFESRLGYRLGLKGVKHFGYYPQDNNALSIAQAQKLMEDKLFHILKVKSDQRILDAGCGEGKVAIHLATKHSCRVVGVDLLDWAIRNAKENAREAQVSDSTDFRTMNYTNLAFKPNTFESLYTMETLVHVSNYQRALQQFYEVLKPGGTVALFEYSISPSKNLTYHEKNIRDIVIDESGMNSLRHFTHDSFPQLLTKAGFVDISVKNITPHVLPMFQKLHDYAYIPYLFIKNFNLQKSFINITCAVEWYRLIQKKDFWRYNIILATKPKAK